MLNHPEYVLTIRDSSPPSPLDVIPIPHTLWVVTLTLRMLDHCLDIGLPSTMGNINEIVSTEVR